MIERYDNKRQMLKDWHYSTNEIISDIDTVAEVVTFKDGTMINYIDKKVIATSCGSYGVNGAVVTFKIYDSNIQQFGFIDNRGTVLQEILWLV